MITEAMEEVFRRWEEHSQRPFWRMVRLFVARIFRGGGDADAEGLDLGVGLVLTLLALPGGFVSILLFEKYGTLLQWMRGATNIDPFASAIPDEYFFITLSMAVTGAVAVWRWDTIFPDRRDYMNLVPLPISTRTIFFANLVAVLFLVGLIAIDVNAASSILFPLVVGATQNAFLFFLRFAAVHALGVVVASAFSFFAVFSVLGFGMAVLPPRTFAKVSPYVRALVVVYLVTLLCTSFALPDFLRRLPGSPPAWTRLLPSCWFLGFCQSLRGHADPTLSALGSLAMPGFGAVIVIAFCVYAVGYQRHFVRIAEISEGASIEYAAKKSWVSSWFDRWLLRTPFQKGCFHFVWKTLFRSESHRLVLAGIGGLGLVLASQALLSAFENGEPAGKAMVSADGLSIPLVLAFFIIVGLRMVFEIPVELRSNWIFRLMLDAEKHECEPLARKVMRVLLLPWVLLISFPIYAYLGGWVVAGLHTLVVVTWSMLLTDAVLIRFRKLPFTCSFPVFQQHSIVTLLGCVFGFFLFAVVTPQMEAWAFVEPVRMIVFLPLAAVGWYVPRYIRQNAMDVEKEIIFEEAPTRAVEVLQLGD
ncbi:MAG: hypothetical protein ABR881_05760 [Candidatus Sulfotelmatobacter sp.]|jgi:hypothetical protein